MGGSAQRGEGKVEGERQDPLLPQPHHPGPAEIWPVPRARVKRGRTQSLRRKLLYLTFVRLGMLVAHT